MRALAAGLLAAWASVACSADAIRITSGYVRQAPPGRAVTAGYCDITNAGSTPVAVIGVSTPAARLVEMHATVSQGDMMRMQRLDRLEIAPGETVRLQSGQTHLMLFDTAPLIEAAYPVTFELSNGGSVTEMFAVRPLIPRD